MPGAFSFSSRFGPAHPLEIIESAIDRPLDSTSISGYSLGAPGAVSDALTTNAASRAAREMRNDGEITLSRTISRRSTASAVVHAHELEERGPGDGRQPGRLASGWNARLSPSGVFHAGYGFGSASVATAESAAGVRHDVDFGFNFARPLPFSGRTVLETETGSTMLSDGRSRRLRLVVRGSLARDLAPRWSSRIEYSRPMQFVAGFQRAVPVGRPRAEHRRPDGTRVVPVDLRRGRPAARSGSTPAPRSTTRTPRRCACAVRSRERGTSKRRASPRASVSTGAEPVGRRAPVAALDGRACALGLSWSAALFRGR